MGKSMVLYSHGKKIFYIKVVPFVWNTRNPFATRDENFDDRVAWETWWFYMYGANFRFSQMDNKRRILYSYLWFTSTAWAFNGVVLLQRKACLYFFTIESDFRVSQNLFCILNRFSNMVIYFEHLSIFSVDVRYNR